MQRLGSSLLTSRLTLLLKVDEACNNGMIYAVTECTEFENRKLAFESSYEICEAIDGFRAAFGGLVGIALAYGAIELLRALAVARLDWKHPHIY